MRLSISLSTRNFSQASKISGFDEFLFFIDNEEIHCHKFLAAFLSNTVSKILLSDPTENSIQIQIPEQIFVSSQQKMQCEQNIIINLKKLLQGETIEINDEEITTMNQQLNNISNSSDQQKYNGSNIISLIILAEALDNEELKQQIYSHILLTNNSNSQQANSKETIEQKLLKLSKIESFLNLLKKFHLSSNYDQDIMAHIRKYLNEDYTQFIKEVASHFYEIDEKMFVNMKSLILNDILTADELKIESEDSLLQILLHRRQFIQSHFTKENEEFFFEKVRYEFLNERTIENFLNELEFIDLDPYLWTSIKKRLVLPVKNEMKNERATSQVAANYKEFVYNGQNQFDGICKYLTDTSNGNIISNNTIEVKNPRICCGDVKTLFDYNNRKCWTHVDSNPAWILFDFKERKVQLNSYAIRTRHVGGHSFLRSWRIEISDDGSNCTLVDERKNIEELNGQDKSHVFNISMTNQFRFIRLTSDLNLRCSNHPDFSIANIEFYGKLYEP
ncbi:hypothetical protein M9Y10_030739 [Tritrichomonas musculus]|uniref:F5/8 type C domain-containing protein n=1 Tax=Tritrichomonas musculus TaxID=1915356 RepID=A0ABR2H3W5_9EUKA